MPISRFQRSLLGLLLISSHRVGRARLSSKVGRRLYGDDARAAVSLPTRRTEEQQERQQRRYYDEDYARQLQVGSDQNCPTLYPEESKIQLSLTEDFLIQKVNVTRELCNVVSREDAADEQRAIYERFEKFSNDCNDQALVAKTHPAGGSICFVTFQAATNRMGSISSFLAFALGT